MTRETFEQLTEPVEYKVKDAEMWIAFATSTFKPPGFWYLYIVKKARRFYWAGNRGWRSSFPKKFSTHEEALADYLALTKKEAN